MNTNNKEAIELIKKVYSWYGFDEFEQFNRDALAKAAKLLQDNQDTEADWCAGCAIHKKPSSKVEKLKAIKNEVVYTTELHVIKDSLINLLNLLIEDEE